MDTDSPGANGDTSIPTAGELSGNTDNGATTGGGASNTGGAPGGYVAAGTGTSAPTGSPASVPKDAQVMVSILKDMGVTEYEPQVINQMLEFSYKYATTVLEDAKTYSNHAAKQSIDADDVKLAIQCKLDTSFNSVPPRDFLVEVAKVKNNTTLPLIKPHGGVRLPPDRYCLNACNYRLRASSKPRPPRVNQHYAIPVHGTGYRQPGSTQLAYRNVVPSAVLASGRHTATSPGPGGGEVKVIAGIKRRADVT